MTAIRYRAISNRDRRRHRAIARGSSREENDGAQLRNSPYRVLAKTFTTLLPRYALLVMISATYLLYRHCNDSLSIPSGLIRPAENPFYDKLDKDQWTVAKRIMNYSYILSLHVFKSFGIEIVGFSHEYGFDCIPEMQSFMDYRLLFPTLLVILLGALLGWSMHGTLTPTQDSSSVKRRQHKEQEDRVQRVLLLLVFLSWMATLFPIAGILKVGTFVADRIVIASSFGTCIFSGRFFALWIIGGGKNDAEDGTPNTTPGKKNITTLKVIFLVYLCANELAKRTHNRATEWMDSAPLLRSSLKVCPRSIKSNLEMSKIYSGLVPHMLDLEKALSLIRTAQSIDPEFCDVHQQYAHVYFQQKKYIPFEEQTVKSLMCKFTSGSAQNNWQKYWEAVLKNGNAVEARKRYVKYMTTIDQAIAGKKAQEEDSEWDSGRINGGMKEEL